MAYPPPQRRVSDPAFALALMNAHPFAHLFTSHAGQMVTRIPFVTDSDAERPTRLRAHLNRQNPQCQGLDGAPVLVAFSGPSTYVSPHWRADKGRGGTYDYEEVVVRGTARVVEGIDSFRRMIDDLSALIEPQYPGVSDQPIWQTTMAGPGYIERQFPQIVQFEISVEGLDMISKLHQHYPESDRRSVADHLERCHRDESRQIGAKIRRSL